MAAIGPVPSGRVELLSANLGPAAAATSMRGPSAPREPRARGAGSRDRDPPGGRGRWSLDRLGGSRFGGSGGTGAWGGALG